MARRGRSIPAHPLISRRPPATALAAGTLAASGHASASVTLSLATNIGGTPPYSSQLQVAPDVSGSPGSYTNTGAPVVGATATLPAAGLSPSTTYWFRAVVTDNVAATANSNAVSQATGQSGDVLLVRVGDSISINALAYGSRTMPAVAAGMLAKLGALRAVGLANVAQGGYHMYNYIPAYGPFSQGDVYSMMIAAVTANPGCYVTLQLGTNDAALSVPAADYATHLDAIRGAVLAAGAAGLIPHHVPYRADADPTMDGLIVAYNAVIDASVNGTTVLQGDQLAYDWFHSNPGELVDQIHPTELGAESLATMQAWAEWRALNPDGSGSGSSGPAHPIRFRIGTP